MSALPRILAKPWAASDPPTLGRLACRPHPFRSRPCPPHAGAPKLPPITGGVLSPPSDDQRSPGSPTPATLGQSPPAPALGQRRQVEPTTPERRASVPCPSPERAGPPHPRVSSPSARPSRLTPRQSPAPEEK
ncbi:hypothetical protein KIL84_002417 [Mauremys mutica]|uniref:Uncharacterized protein n=1 Tax=Mauremys mutica TaxID=74926 RepID=A0A9D3X7F0_9SAUR|nr:hypothetical protein KIL84_002417 [Mauremys mutica]